MIDRFVLKHMSSFRIILAGFLAIILAGTVLLMLPVSGRSGAHAAFSDALFTATSAVCVTGLVVADTASRWSGFGQAVILLLIQIGGLGIVCVAAFIAAVAGRKISVLQRTMLQESISAPQVGGVVRLTVLIFGVALISETAGAAVMLPKFCSAYGPRGIWMAVFHSVSAFCNAGFDIMGTAEGEFSSLTRFAGDPGIVLPVCLLIVVGGIGFLTWEDVAAHGLHLKRYRMQSKVILSAAAVLILVPGCAFFFNDFAAYPLKERLCLSLFQAVTPRTAGFNTADLNSMTSAGRAITIVLMLIGGAPGSAAGGMKTTTIAVLLANSGAVFRRRKNPQMFGRRIDEYTVKCASTLLMLYLFLALSGAFILSAAEGLPFETCLFETASAIGTVGLSLGITPVLGAVSRLTLILLMFFGRVGGLTMMFAAVNGCGMEVGRCPAEKIAVG